MIKKNIFFYKSEEFSDDAFLKLQVSKQLHTSIDKLFGTTYNIDCVFSLRREKMLFEQLSVYEPIIFGVNNFKSEMVFVLVLHLLKLFLQNNIVFVKE